MLKGEDPEKALESIKEAFFPNVSSAELGITDDLNNPEEAEKQIIDWCKEIQS